MADSIFTKIIKGEVPAHRVYEDELTLAFLDIRPFTAGHTLVIPKKQVDHLWDLDDKTYEYLMKVAKKVALRQREVLNPPRVGVVVEGFAVPHVHIHIFPMYEGLKETVENRIAEPSEQALAAMAEKLKFTGEN